MRVLVLGASGAVGKALVPRLIEAGHKVAATSRTRERAERLSLAGAEPYATDLLDAASIARTVDAASPDAVINQATSIPQRINTRRIEREFAQTNRLRAQGTANLIAALRGSEARLIAQSVAFAYAPSTPGKLHGEDDPLDLAGTRTSAAISAAVSTMEEAVGAAGGTVLRYGYFYGPATAFSRTGSSGQAVAKRQFPVVGDGAGVWSFIHIDDAAGAAVAALTGPPGVFNVVDEHPAPVAQWLPAFASALGAPSPRRVPVWLARLAAGRYGVNAMTRSQGASCALAREKLGFSARFADWRVGFREGLG